jgi:hypothetical protein
VAMTSIDRLLMQRGEASSAPSELADLAGEVAAAFAGSFQRDFVKVDPTELTGAEDPETIAEPSESASRASRVTDA